MPDTETPFPPFWINDRDHHGRPLEPRVIERPCGLGTGVPLVIHLLKDPAGHPKSSSSGAACHEGCGAPA
jgi:hypothetical protein